MRSTGRASGRGSETTETSLLISDSGHEMDALGHAGEEGRCRPRKSTVSCQTSVDQCVSEWGNPTGVTSSDPVMSEVVMGGKRGELKHLSTRRSRNQARDSLSSGERNGNSLNQRACPLGLRDLNVRSVSQVKRHGKAGHRR